MLAASLAALQAQPAVAGEPEAPVPFEAVRPGPPASPVSEAARPGVEQLPDLTEVRSWAIPPVRWGGTSTSTYTLSQSGPSSRSFTETQAVNLHANSFVYQPWFAQVSGNVGLMSGTASMGNDSRSRSTAATYGGNVNLFPQSRFPFQAYLQTSDSRASASAVSSQYTMTQMGASQSYRPAFGQANYSAGADRSIASGAGMRSVVDALRAAFNTTVDTHNVSANARYSSSSGDVAGQGSKFMNLSGTHSWHSDEEELGVSSTATFSRNQVSILSPRGLIENQTNLMQLGSSVSWTPDEDVPLTISGGGNFLHMATLTDTGNIALANLNAFATANYRFSNNLVGSGGANVTRVMSNGISQMAIGENANLSYSGNPLTIGEFSYNWGGGAGVSNQTMSGGGSSRNISSSAQHSLTRIVNLDAFGTLSFNGSQGLALSSSSGFGITEVLTHGLGASWRQGFSERTQGAISANASDTLSNGQFANHFRSLSMQGNLQSQLTSRSAVTAALNVSASQQLATPPQNTQTISLATPSTANNRPNLNGSANFGYTHRSPFNISNLMYMATLQFTASQNNLRLITGDPNAPAWQTGTVFQQNADYRMGRLIFRATTSFAELNGKKNASVFFMMGREFGD